VRRKEVEAAASGEHKNLHTKRTLQLAEYDAKHSLAKEVKKKGGACMSLNRHPKQARSAKRCHHLREKLYNCTSTLAQAARQHVYI